MATRRRYIDIPDHARRDFIKWTVGLGAALGLRPWKVFEVNESIVGPAVAQQASCASVNRFVGNIMGNGGFAWMNQLWPHIDQSTKAGASFYATGMATAQAMDGAGDKAFMLGPAAPFKTFNKKMTAFICGTNETHTGMPVSAANIATGVRLFAAVSALQTASPTLVPSIGIGTLPYGTASGAPAIASVANPAGHGRPLQQRGLVGGRNARRCQRCVAVRGLLQGQLQPARGGVAPDDDSGYLTGKVAANLSAKTWRAAHADRRRPQRYGITSGTATKIRPSPPR